MYSTKHCWCLHWQACCCFPESMQVGPGLTFFFMVTSEPTAKEGSLESFTDAIHSFMQKCVASGAS